MKPRIAYFFLDRPNYTAGPRINALRVLPEFARRGYEVVATVGYQQSCPAEKELVDSGVKVVKTIWPEYCEQQVDWFYKVLAKVSPDVFVANTSVAACYAGRFLRESGRPTVLAHLSDDQQNWGMAERFVQRQDEWSVSGVFCMSRESANLLESWNTPTTVSVIPHGVPITNDVADQSGPLKIVYSGRLEERQKRISDLVEAICKILRRIPSSTARIIGDGSERNNVERQIAESGVADRIELLGYVAPENVQSEIRKSNTLVLLSDYEGVPGAVMDAMSSGVVPVCLDIPGGLRELVVDGKTGILVQDRNESFHHAIDSLNTDYSLRERLANSARDHVTKHYSLKSTVDRWEHLFESLTKDARPKKTIRFPKTPRLPYPDYSIIGADKRAKEPSLADKFRESVSNPSRTIEWLRSKLPFGKAAC